MRMKVPGCWYAVCFSGPYCWPFSISAHHILFSTLKVKERFFLLNAQLLQICRLLNHLRSCRTLFYQIQFKNYEMFTLFWIKKNFYEILKKLTKPKNFQFIGPKSLNYIYSLKVFESWFRRICHIYRFNFLWLG